MVLPNTAAKLHRAGSNAANGFGCDLQAFSTSLATVSSRLSQVPSTATPKGAIICSLRQPGQGEEASMTDETHVEAIRMLVETIKSSVERKEVDDKALFDHLERDEVDDEAFFSQLNQTPSLNLMQYYLAEFIKFERATDCTAAPSFVPCGCETCNALRTTMCQAAGIKGRGEAITGDVRIDRINLLSRLGRVDYNNFRQHLDKVDRMSVTDHLYRVDLIAHLAEVIGLAAIIPTYSVWGELWLGTWGSAQFFLKELIDRQRAVNCTAMPVVWVKDGGQYLPGPALAKKGVNEITETSMLLLPCRCDMCAALRTKLREAAGIEGHK